MQCGGKPGMSNTLLGGGLSSPIALMGGRRVDVRAGETAQVIVELRRK